jgi:hypothetical protein
MRYCVRRDWLSDNYASIDYGMTTSKICKPKEPFSETEFFYIYRAANEVVHGIGKHVHNGVERVKELVAFIWTLRYTGLRISDVVQLELNQLQPFQLCRVHSCNL